MKPISKWFNRDNVKEIENFLSRFSTLPPAYKPLPIKRTRIKHVFKKENLIGDTFVPAILPHESAKILEEY